MCVFQHAGWMYSVTTNFVLCVPDFWWVSPRFPLKTLTQDLATPDLPKNFKFESVVGFDLDAAFSDSP